MKKVQGLALPTMMFAVVCVSVLMAGVSHAQGDAASFVGKFTLTTPVQWQKTILQPGDYTFTVWPREGNLTLVYLRHSKGDSVGFFLSAIRDERKSDRNALFLKNKDGQLRVYSLELASLGQVLVYDPALAREAVTEARALQTAPVMVAKR